MTTLPIGSSPWVADSGWGENRDRVRERGRCDALQVLSEGHIRCLGLAILLAKITRDGLRSLYSTTS